MSILEYFEPKTLEEWIDATRYQDDFHSHRRKIGNEIHCTKSELEYAREEVAKLEARLKLAQEQESLFWKAQEVIRER